MQFTASLAAAVLLGLAAAAPQTTTPAPPPPSPTPGSDILPVCVGAYQILRFAGCGYGFINKQCDCGKPYGQMEQSIQANCNAADAQIATSTLNDYCGYGTGCNGTDPSIFSLPSCAESCAVSIDREYCTVLNNNACTCSKRPDIDACIQSSCSAVDQQTATCTLNALCGTS